MGCCVNTSSYYLISNMKSMFIARFQKSAGWGMDFFIFQQMSNDNSPDLMMEEILVGFHLREKGNQCDIAVKCYLNFFP